MRRTVLAAALAAAGSVMPPASAAAPSVAVLHTIKINNVGGGYVVVAACGAQARAGSATDQIPAGTAVSCTVAGVTAGLALPGGAAALVVEAAAAGQFTVCVTGEASFVDVTTNEILRATNTSCTAYQTGG